MLTAAVPNRAPPVLVGSAASSFARLIASDGSLVPQPLVLSSASTAATATKPAPTAAAPEPAPETPPTPPPPPVAEKPIAAPLVDATPRAIDLHTPGVGTLMRKRIAVLAQHLHALATRIALARRDLVDRASLLRGIGIINGDLEAVLLGGIRDTLMASYRDPDAILRDLGSLGTKATVELGVAGAATAGAAGAAGVAGTSALAAVLAGGGTAAETLVGVGAVVSAALGDWATAALSLLGGTLATGAGVAVGPLVAGALVGGTTAVTGGLLVKKTLKLRERRAILDMLRSVRRDRDCLVRLLLAVEQVRDRFAHLTEFATRPDIAEDERTWAYNEAKRPFDAHGLDVATAEAVAELDKGAWVYPDEVVVPPLADLLDIDD
ncbi:hypothetical protein H9P43_002662 [Blastocladiella emersonii ATCC 22665]|nr:hypothetical protein H9P43_002662 [Blastocladiella emersonii ATCC 22665]